MKNKLYMAVTPDKYELPLHVSDTVLSMSQWSGISQGNILSAISRKRSGKRIGMKFVSVEIDNDN